MSRHFFHSLFLAGAALVLSAPAAPVAAAGCCVAGEPAPAPAPPLPGRPGPRWASAPLAPWMFATPVAGRPRRAAGGRQFDYMFERHLWLMGGVRTVPTGRPLDAETSNADRTAFSQAGLGLGYVLSPAVRAISSWTTGLGPNTVSPGSQFIVGVAWRY